MEEKFFKWGRPIHKDGIIIRSGYGEALDWYSKEAKEQRKREIWEDIHTLYEKLAAIDKEEIRDDPTQDQTP